MLQAGHSLLPRRWHCSDSGDFRGFPAVILEFGPKLANRCIDSGDLLGFRASILDFRPKLGNRCTDSGDLLGFRASILDFKPRIENHRSNVGLQAKLIFVAATKIRVGRGTSQQRRTTGETNLRRSYEDQNWTQNIAQRRTAGETNLRRCNEDQSRTRNIAATATKGEIFR